MWIGCSPNQTCVRFGEPQRRLASRGLLKPIQMRGVVDREQVTVEEEMLMLHSENLHEKHKYAPLRGPIDDQENKKRMKRFQIVQHNSYINSRQVIAKKSVNSTGKAQLPSTGLAHFSRDQSFNKKTTLALGIECEAQVSFIVTHGINLIIVQLKYLH